MTIKQHLKAIKQQIKASDPSILELTETQTFERIADCGGIPFTDAVGSFAEWLGSFSSCDANIKYCLWCFLAELEGLDIIDVFYDYITAQTVKDWQNSEK